MKNVSLILKFRASVVDNSVPLMIAGETVGRVLRFVNTCGAGGPNGISNMSRFSLRRVIGLVVLHCLANLGIG